MFSALILLPDIKMYICIMGDNDSNTSSNNSESETELPDFHILKPFSMELGKKVSIKNYAQY